jgi:predicted PurR-regulated permease PerM
VDFPFPQPVILWCNGEMNSTSGRPVWSSLTKFTIVLLLVGLGIFLLYRFRLAIRPLVVASIIAYILSPLVQRLQDRLHLHRGLAILLSYLILILVAVIIPLVVIPPLADDSSGLKVDFQRLIGEVEKLLANQYTVAGYTVDPRSAFENAIGSVQGMVEPIFSETLLLAFEAITSLVWVVFAAVVSFYLIKDSNKLHRWMESMVPSAYLGDFITLRAEINLIWSAFFRGQLTLAFTVASILTVAGFIIGMPFALGMGVLGGLLEFLPSLGHGIWLVLATLLALFAGSTWLPIPNWVFALLVIALHLPFQQFDLNYLIPRIIGRRVQLPPLVVILGIVSGALMAGVLGIFLAAPTIASARVLGRYIYANLLNQNPFGPEIAPPLPPPDPRWWRKHPSPPGE